MGGLFGYCVGGIIIFLSLTVGVSRAAAEITLEFRPAWNGVVRPGAWSEIGVRVLSPTGRTITLTFDGAAERTVARLAVRAREPRTIWVPIRPRGNSPVVVRASDDAGFLSEVIIRSFKPPYTRRIVAAAMTKAWPTSATRARLPRTQFLLDTVDALPRNAQAYDAIDALVLDVPAMSRLDPEQLNALRRHIMDCGRTMVLAVDAAGLVAQLRDIAGCGGNFLKFFHSIDQAPPILAQLLASPRPAAPGQNNLKRLISPDQPLQWHWPVAGFIVVYFIVMALSAVVFSTSWAVMAVPALATGLALTVWAWGSPALHLIVWTEASATDHSGRYAAILHVEGRGKTDFRFELPVSVVIAGPLPKNAELRRDAGKQGWNLRSVTIPNHLLSSNDIYFAGGATGRVPNIVWSVEDGVEQIKLSDGGLPRGAVYSTGDALYAVPPLARGAVWRPRKSDRLTTLTTAEQLFETLHRDAGPELLMPYLPDEVKALPAGADAQGWLRLRLSRNRREAGS